MVLQSNGWSEKNRPSPNLLVGLFVKKNFACQLEKIFLYIFNSNQTVANLQKDFGTLCNAPKNYIFKANKQWLSNYVMNIIFIQFYIDNKIFYFILISNLQTIMNYLWATYGGTSTYCTIKPNSICKVLYACRVWITLVYKSSTVLFGTCKQKW